MHQKRRARLRQQAQSRRPARSATGIGVRRSPWRVFRRRCPLPCARSRRRSQSRYPRLPDRRRARRPRALSRRRAPPAQVPRRRQCRALPARAQLRRQCRVRHLLALSRRRARCRRALAADRHSGCDARSVGGGRPSQPAQDLQPKIEPREMAAEVRKSPSLSETRRSRLTWPTELVPVAEGALPLVLDNVQERVGPLLESTSPFPGPLEPLPHQVGPVQPRGHERGAGRVAVQVKPG